MPEVDPVTGLPKEEVEKPATMEKYNRLNEQRARSDQLVEEIKSEQGSIILRKIQEHLLVRINKFIEEDGECRSLKRILVDMGVTINIGEKAVENLMRLLVKK